MTFLLTRVILASELFAAHLLAFIHSLRIVGVLFRATLDRTLRPVTPTRLLDVHLTRAALARVTNLSAHVLATREHLLARSIAYGHTSRAAFHLEFHFATLARSRYHCFTRRTRTRMTQQSTFMLTFRYYC